MHKGWERIETHLRSALALVDVESSERRLIEEFLDHNELGLAFEILTGALAGMGKAPSPAAREHLAAAASDMGREDDPDWLLINAAAS